MLHVHDTVMNTALAGYSLQISLSCLRIAISQVLLNCVIKEDSILRHDNDMLAE